MFEDILYFTSLAVSISLGPYYKSLDEIEVKKHYGTGLGILIAFLICGHYLYHTILMVWLNVIILKSCDRRFVHLASLTYTWMHLIYLHTFLVDAEYVILLHQNIALRLVGMAFEIFTANKELLIKKEIIAKTPLQIKKDANATTSEEVEKKVEIVEYDYILECTTSDILSYAFFFIGLHQGPYFKYKVYYDHFTLPFGTMGNFRHITEFKIKKIFTYASAYLLLWMKFSSEIYHNPDFYELDAETRYLFNVPFLLMFVLKRGIIMLLCTSACTELGFGVYPADTKPKPGQGPTARFSLLNLKEEQEVLRQKYNFSVLKSFDKEKLMVGPKMIDTVRSWDMPTGYWFWVNIHRDMFRASKETRSALSFLAWALWNGASLQACIISSTIYVYIHIESEYTKIFKTDQMKVAWNIGFSIMRMFCLIYLTPCFVLSDALIVMTYYNSIFWVFHFILFVLILGAVISLKTRKIEEPQLNRPIPPLNPPPIEATTSKT